MSSESATNLTVTSSQSVQHVSNCVTQLNSNSIENARFSDDFSIFVVTNVLFSKCIWANYDEVTSLLCYIYCRYHIKAQRSTVRDSQIYSPRATII